MLTVQQVYDMAIHLMDEQDESTGKTETVDTVEYKLRTISILNSIIPALYPYSGNYDTSGTGRPTPPMLYVDDYANPDFEQAIWLDDTLCAAVLPYYLAAQLLSSENDTLSAWFLARYREAFADLKSRIPATFERISTPYGLF
ncbi:MAG: hypothetical protein ACI3VA_07975 [Candidatus Limivicinus sp.]